MSTTTAPERIWAQVRGAGISVPSNTQYLMGNFEDRPNDKATEYVRADLVADMEMEGA